MTVSELFKAIRKRQVDEAVSTFQPYHGLLVAMVEEKEFDSHEAEIIIEQHGKTERQFEADVETMRKRLQEVRAIEQAANAARTVTQAQAAIDQVAKERQDVYDATQSKLDAAIRDQQTANALISRRRAAERTLSSTVLDPAILDASTDLAKRQGEIQAERVPLAALLDANHAGTTANCLVIEQGHVRKWTAKVKSAGKKESEEYAQRQLDLHISRSKGFRDRVTTAQKRLAELDNDLRQIEGDNSKLDAKKLIP